MPEDPHRKRHQFEDWTFLPGCEREEVLSAVRALVDEYGFSDVDAEAAPGVPAPVGAETEIALYHSSMPEWFRVRAEDLPDFVRDGSGAWDGTFLRSRSKTLARVEAVNATARLALATWTSDELLADGVLPARSATENVPSRDDDVDEQWDVDLLIGMTPAVLAIIRADDWDKYYGPLLDGEAYVRVYHEDSTSEEALQTTIAAYLFELSATCGLELRVAGRTPVSEIGEGEEDEPPSAETPLRRLLAGPGIRDVLELYNRAVATDPADLQIFGFAKVLEFVGATVVRLTGYQELRAKLSSRRVLDPDSAFLGELRRLVERQQELREDKRVMDLVIKTCCVADELKREAPACCELLQKLSDKATGTEEAKALGDFAERLTATRNAVAHAKSNYTPSPMECPEAQHHQFARATRLAAEQAIRWFARTDAALRTVQRP